MLTTSIQSCSKTIKATTWLLFTNTLSLRITNDLERYTKQLVQHTRAAQVSKPLDLEPWDSDKASLDLPSEQKPHTGHPLGSGYHTPHNSLFPISTHQRGNLDRMFSTQFAQDPIASRMATSQQHNQSVLLVDQIKQCLREPFPEPNSTPRIYIHNEQDFAVKMQAYRSLCDQDHLEAELGQELNDFPTDVETQRQLVQQLVEAMTNMNAQDKDAKIPVGRIKKLSPIEFNLMAWAVLLEIRDIQRGQIFLPRWGKEWEWQECHSFYDRFELVRSALHSHKTIVSSLFDYPFVKRLALHPTAELERKKCNKILNRKRKQDLAIARKLKLQQQAAQSTSRPARPNPRRRTRGPSSRSPADPADQAQQAASTSLQTGSIISQDQETDRGRGRSDGMVEETYNMGPAISTMQMGQGIAAAGNANMVRPSPHNRMSNIGNNASASNTYAGPGPQWPASTQGVNDATFTIGSGYLSQQAPVRKEDRSPDFGIQHQPVSSQQQYMGRTQLTQPAPAQGFLNARPSMTIQQETYLASPPQSFTNVHQWLSDTVQAADTVMVSSANSTGVEQGFLETFDYSNVHMADGEQPPAPNQDQTSHLQGIPDQSNDMNGGLISDDEFQKLLDSPLDAGLGQWWQENDPMLDPSN